MKLKRYPPSPRLVKARAAVAAFRARHHVPLRVSRLHPLAQEWAALQREARNAYAAWAMNIRRTTPAAVRKNRAMAARWYALNKGKRAAQYRARKQLKAILE